MKIHTLITTLLLSTCLSTSVLAIIPFPQQLQSYKQLPYRGVTLAGGAFANNNAQDTLGFVPTANDAVIFAYKGMNTYRIPIAWEYLATSSNDFTLNTQSPYWQQVKNTIATLTAKGAYVIIDMHDYMRFNYKNIAADVSQRDTSHVIGNGQIGIPSVQDFANLWQTIVKNLASIKNNNHLMFELMNEPHDVTASVLTTTYRAAITAIRQQESQLKETPHTIILDGMSWTGLHNWSTNNTGNNDWLSGIQAKIHDNHLMLAVHQYFDSDFSGTHHTCQIITKTTIANWFTDLDTYSAAHQGIPYILGEFGAPYTQNCQNDISNTLSVLTKDSRANAYAQGWIVWAAGHAWYANYVDSIAPGACHGNQYLYANQPYGNGYTDYLTKIATPPNTLPSKPTFSIMNQSTHTLSISQLATNYPVNYTKPSCWAYPTGSNILIYTTYQTNSHQEKNILPLTGKAFLIKLAVYDQKGADLTDIGLGINNSYWFDYATANNKTEPLVKITSINGTYPNKPNPSMVTVINQ